MTRKPLNSHLNVLSFVGGGFWQRRWKVRALRQCAVLTSRIIEVSPIAPFRPHNRTPPIRHTMPLPIAPKNQPNNSQNRNKLAQANNELLFKGVLCMLIGLGVLLSPYFITSPGMQGIVAQSALVGWFALVLGVAFAGLYVWRRIASKTAP